MGCSGAGWFGRLFMLIVLMIISVVSNDWWIGGCWVRILALCFDFRFYKLLRVDTIVLGFLFDLFCAGV